MRDPFDGLNPFTGIDDGLTAPVASPLVFEIDVLGKKSQAPIPEPSSMILFWTGIVVLAAIARRKN